MKYRLKKDLPFAKAGTPIDYFVNNQTTVCIGNRYCDLPKDIQPDWIEEVKPREWWALRPKDHSTAGQNVRFYLNPGYARDDYEKETNKNWFEIIKVREVIE